MQKIRSEHLVPYARLDRPFYDQSGQLLIARGTRVVPPMIAALDAAGITEGVLLDHSDELRVLQGQPRYESRSIRTIIPGQIITQSMFDEQGNLLLAADSVIPGSLVETLKARKVESVLLSKEMDVDRVGRFSDSLAREWARNLDDQIDNSSIPLAVERKGVPTARRMRVWRGKRRPAVELSRISQRRDSLLSETEEILDILQMGAGLKRGRIERIAEQIVDLTCDDKDVCLALASFPDAGAALPRIGVDVSFVAVAMGLMMGHNEAQIRTLAMGAFLHDVGMLSVPAQIVEKNGRFNRHELSVMRNHPLNGLALLARVPDATVETALVVYQSHERDSGVGYPRAASGEGVHDYAKIVGIADAYHALVNPRAHRDESLPYDALANISKMSGLGMFSKEFVLALVHALGSFPVGSWVKLSTGEVAHVVGVSPAAFDRPKVSVVLDEYGVALEEPQVLDLTQMPGVELTHVSAPVRFMDNPLEAF